MSAPRAAAQLFRMAMSLEYFFPPATTRAGDGAARHPYHRAKHIFSVSLAERSPPAGCRQHVDGPAYCFLRHFDHVAVTQPEIGARLGLFEIENEFPRFASSPDRRASLEPGSDRMKRGGR
jgi:hypothetical protein